MIYVKANPKCAICFTSCVPSVLLLPALEALAAVDEAIKLRYALRVAHETQLILLYVQRNETIGFLDQKTNLLKPES
jgi:hypothetical protein